MRALHGDGEYMRIWDISPARLCRNHLLGEHAELHATWSILTKHKKGYSHHPEVVRWQGKLKALYLRHGKLVREMGKRGYDHASALQEKSATGSAVQDVYVDTPRRQLDILRKKRCRCRV